MIDEECIYYFFNKNKNNQCQLKETKKTKQTKKQFISKLINFDFFMQNEIYITNKLREVLDYKQKFYLFDSIENTQGIRDTSVLIRYENMGLIKFDIYQSSLSCSRIYINTIIESYRHLLNTIDILFKNKIVHNNIHFETIVTNKSYTLLTDFSNALDINKLETNKLEINKYIQPFVTTYVPNNVFKPMELHVLSYLITNKYDSISNNNINCVLDDILQHHTILPHFGKQFVTNFKNDGTKFLQRYVNKSIPFICNDILTYYDTWDNYSLSVSYLIILIGIHKNIKHSNKFVITFMRHLLENISFNPLKRCSVETTTNKFEEMIYEIEPSSYARLLNAL